MMVCACISWVGEQSWGVGSPFSPGRSEGVNSYYIAV